VEYVAKALHITKNQSTNYPRCIANKLPEEDKMADTFESCPFSPFFNAKYAVDSKDQDQIFQQKCLEWYDGGAQLIKGEFLYVFFLPYSIQRENRCIGMVTADTLIFEVLGSKNYNFFQICFFFIYVCCR